MSFQDPPRRPRQPRYPALAQYEDGYPSHQDAGANNGNGNGYRGGAGAAGTPRQRPPWDDLRERSAWDSGGWGSGAAGSGAAGSGAAGNGAGSSGTGSSGAQRALRDSAANRTLRDSGAQQPVRNTGAQPPLRTSGAQPSAWDPRGQGTGQSTSWDTPRLTERGLPRRTSGAFHAASEEDDDRGRLARARHRGTRPDRGLLAGALTGFLSAAVALGVANLVAAFVRPQASPIIAVGEAFIDRTPPALKNFAVQKFGENDKNMLLLGMYVTIALIAISVGMLAWRRVAIGVTGIGLFGLFGAFVAITRPDSHVTDVIPSIVGGMAGIAAIVLLVRAGTPRARSAWARGRQP